MKSACLSFPPSWLFLDTGRSTARVAEQTGICELVYLSSGSVSYTHLDVYKRQIFSCDSFLVHRLRPIDFCNNRIFPIDLSGELFCKTFIIHHIADADACPLHLVHITRPDSLIGSAYLSAAFGSFAESVQQLVIGKHDMRTVTDKNIGCIDTVFFEICDFVKEARRIEYDAVSDDIYRRRVQHPRRDVYKRQLLL